MYFENHGFEVWVIDTSTSMRILERQGMQTSSSFFKI